MYYVLLAPLGGILGPMKSDLGLFLPFWAKTHFLQKGPFPSTDLAENLCVDSQTPPGPKSKSWQMGNSWPKKIVQARGASVHFNLIVLWQCA